MSDYAKYVGGENENASTVNRSYKKGATYAYVFTAALGGFFFGYIMSCFNIVLSFVEYVAYSQPVEQSFTSWITALVPLGAGAGSLLTGKIASSIGRKKTMMLADVIGIIGTVLTCLPSPWPLLFGRLIQGYSVGSNSSIVPLYISEVAPLEAAGSMGTINQLFICIGVLVAPLLGFGMPTDQNNDDGGHYENSTKDKYFLLVLGFAAIPAILRLILSLLVFNMETPKYLVSQGKDDEALEILNKIYENGRGQEELTTLQRQQEIEAQSGKLTAKDIFSRKYKRRVIIGALMSIFQQFSGINAIIFFSNQIFTGGVTSVTLSTAILDLFQLLSTLAAGFVIERFGRKLLFAGGMIGVSALLIIFGILYMIDQTSAVLKFLLWAYMIAFGLAVGPIPWIYISDILPDIAVGVAVLANWASAFIIGLTFQPLVDAIGLQWGFFIFGICSIVGAVFGLIVMKETKGKSKVEIEELFRRGGPNGELTSSLRA